MGDSFSFQHSLINGSLGVRFLSNFPFYILCIWGEVQMGEEVIKQILKVSIKTARNLLMVATEFLNDTSDILKSIGEKVGEKKEG